MDIWSEAYIVVLDELSATTRQHRPKHALALAKAGVLALLVLDIDIEGVALEEQLEITVVLQNWMRRRLVEHALQCRTSRFDEIGIESTYRLLLRRRGDDDSGIVAVQLIV